MLHLLLCSWFTDIIHIGCRLVSSDDMTRQSTINTPVNKLAKVEVVDSGVRFHACRILAELCFSSS